MAGARAATPRKVDQALAKERGTSQQGFRDRTGKQLPLNAPISALGSAGVAVALYFYTVWAMIFVFLGAFVINLPTLTHNWAAHPDKGWVMRLSLGPYSQLEPDDMISKQALPSMLVAFLFIGFLMWLDRKEASVATEVDRGFTTSGDFSVEVRNIPVGKSGEADLKSYFGKWGAVHSVIVAYKSSKFMLKRNEWEALNLERVEMQAALDLKEEGGSTDQAGREKLRAVRERLREVEQDMARMQTASKEATGVAFCVYDTEQSRFKCLDAHKRTFFRWLLHKVTFGCLGNNPKYLKSYELDVMAAPEPSDVNWQNLHYTRAEVSVRAFRTLVASMVLIGFSAAFFIEFDRWTQAEVEQLQKTKSHAEADQWGQVISIAVPVVVTLVNFALSYLIGRMTAYEHRYTKTDYEQSLFFKVALTIVINQSMLGLFVNPKPSDWWDNSGGAMTDALYNAISNFQPELQKFIQPELVVSRYMIARMAASQKRADRHWEPPETSLGEFYASATTIAALGIIYGPAMPLCYLITAGALFASYVSNKYTFLRVFKNPPMLNSGLSDIFSNYVAFALACSLALQSVMYGTYDDGSAAAEEGVGSFPIVALVFLLIYIFVPMPCLRAKAVETVDTKGAKFSKVEGLVNYECPLTGPLPSFESDEMEEARTDAKKPLARPGSAKWERQMSARSGKPQGAKRLTVRMPWSKKKPQSVTML